MERERHEAEKEPDITQRVSIKTRKRERPTPTRTCAACFLFYISLRPRLCLLSLSLEMICRPLEPLAFRGDSSDERGLPIPDAKSSALRTFLLANKSEVAHDRSGKTLRPVGDTNVEFASFEWPYPLIRYVRL